MLTHKTKNCHKSVCSLLKLRAPSLMAENNFDWQLYTNTTKIGICISALMMHTEVVSNLVYLSLSNNNKEHLFRTVAKNWKNCAIINIVAASPYQISHFLYFRTLCNCKGVVLSSHFPIEFTSKKKKMG